MKPIQFKHQNVTFAEDQPEYQPLPALKIDSPEGDVLSGAPESITYRANMGKSYVI